MNESDYRWVDDPTVAVTSDRRVGVAWADQAQQNVFYQQFDDEQNARFEKPTNVSSSPETFSWLPRIAFGEDASPASEQPEVYALWQEIVFSGGTHGGEIYFSASRDGGRSFEAPTNLSHSRAGDGKGRLSRRVWDNGSLDLAYGGSGAIYTAWTEYEGRLWFRRSLDHGRTFEAPVLLAGGPHSPMRAPSVAARGDVVHVAWARGERDSGGIFVASSRDGGKSFEASEQLFRDGSDGAEAISANGHSDAPNIAIGPDGSVHLAFTRQNHIEYSFRDLGDPVGGAFARPRRLSASGVVARYPDLAIDDSGEIYVLWEEYPGGSKRPRELGFTHSSDAGDGFRAAMSLPHLSGTQSSFSGSQQGLLMSKLAVNAAGWGCAVNSTFEPNVRSVVLLSCGRASELGR